MQTTNTVAVQAPPLIYVYSRWSKKSQVTATKGDSKRRQSSKADDYCEKRGWPKPIQKTDPGVSAFRRRNIEFGKLGKIIDAVIDGDIPRGSVLLIEDLDRFSRGAPLKAAAELESIVEAGLTVITLIDGIEYNQENIKNVGMILLSVVKFVNAHDESLKKSKRIKEQWAAKRAKAANDKKPMTGKLPWWCEMKHGEIVCPQEKEELLRRIFSMAMSMGVNAIVEKLNDDHVKIGYKRGVHRGCIYKTLRNPAVYGSFQPHYNDFDADKPGANATRKPIGEAIEQYYPEVIKYRDFCAVQATMKERGGKKNPDGKRTGGLPGGRTAGFVNLLSGIFGHTEDPNDGNYIAWRGTLGRRCYVSSLANEEQRDWISHPTQSIDLSIIHELHHLGKIVLPENDDDSVGRRIKALEGEIDRINDRIKQLDDAMMDLDSTQEIPSVTRNLAKFDTLRASKVKELEALHAKPGTAVLTDDLHIVADADNRALDDYDALNDKNTRLRLREAIRRLVTRITGSFEHDGAMHSADITIHLASGQKHTYNVRCHRNHPYGIAIRRPGEPSFDWCLYSGASERDQWRDTSKNPDGTIKLDHVWGVYAREEAREMWLSGATAKEISKELKIGVHQVYGLKPRTKKLA